MDGCQGNWSAVLQVFWFCGFWGIGMMVDGWWLRSTTTGLDHLPIIMFNPCRASLVLPDVSFFSTFSLCLILLNVAFLLNSFCSSLILAFSPCKKAFFFSIEQALMSSWSIFYCLGLFSLGDSFFTEDNVWGEYIRKSGKIVPTVIKKHVPVCQLKTTP